ncbi:MAG: DUF222 domain-containing protein [Glaciihabitans sp.]
MPADALPDEDGYITYSADGLLWTEERRPEFPLLRRRAQQGELGSSDTGNISPEQPDADHGAGKPTSGLAVSTEVGSPSASGPDSAGATPSSPGAGGGDRRPSRSIPADPFEDTDEARQDDADAAGHSDKRSAYEDVQTLLDGAAASDRVAARANADRARKIEAARLATLKVEHDFPRQEASAGAKTKGWTATVVAERSFVTMVAAELRISGRAAEHLINTTRTLHVYFERTLQLLETGTTSYRHAQIVVEECSGVPEELLAEYESLLLPFATTLTPPQFTHKARMVAAKYSPNTLATRHREALTHRAVTLTPAEDGMANLKLYVDATAATAIFNRATDAAKHLKAKTEDRTLTQRRADVATELLLTGTTHQAGTPTIDALNFRSFDRFVTAEDIKVAGKSGAILWEEEHTYAVGPILGDRVVGTGLGSGITAQVSVHVPAMSLLEHGSEPAYLDQYGPISIETAKLIMGSVSTFNRVLTDPDSGVVLSVGKTRYSVPAAMRLWLLFRDATCRFPGCAQPARVCDLDHVNDWQYGGATEVANLTCLCEAHHNVKHHTDWTYSLDPDGTAFWISPTGRRYTTQPAVLMLAA